MARITSQVAAAKVGGLYDLILIASRRVRELRHGWAPQVQREYGDLVTAIQEVEQGHVGRDYLLKPPTIDRKERPPTDHK